VNSYTAFEQSKSLPEVLLRRVSGNMYVTAKITGQIVLVVNIASYTIINLSTFEKPSVPLQLNREAVYV
jgi:hypothetical protein